MAFCTTPGLFACLWLVCLPFTLRAHPADEGGLRARVAPGGLELRLTFSLLTLSRFVVIDTDQDAKISIAELDAAREPLAAWLNRHVLLKINQQAATLGPLASFELLWPNARDTPPMTDLEHALRSADLVFTPAFKGLLQNFWIGFDVFERAGPQQLIRGRYEQEELVTETLFTAAQPEFEYETGFADDPFVLSALSQAPDSKPPQAADRRLLALFLAGLAAAAAWCIRRGGRVKS